MIHTFKPVLKPTIWGGSRLAGFKGLAEEAKGIGESWEISGIPGSESTVDCGPDTGLTLTELASKHGAALLGHRVWQRYGTQFPLLIKLIDAARDLSVQVHPDDMMARRHHGPTAMGKTEMWYIIDADPGAQIHSGLSRQVTPDDFERLVCEGRVMDVVCHSESHPGDVYFLPAGRIHAIGAGNLLAEIQEASDITYRIYDYGRLQPDGTPRELHAERAREAVDYSVASRYTTEYDRLTPGETPLVACNCFTVNLVKVDGHFVKDRTGSDCFLIVICLDGEMILNGSVTLTRGHTALVGADEALVMFEGNGRLLTATL